MFFDVMSDLHFDAWMKPVNVLKLKKSDNIIIAGDVNDSHEDTFEYIKNLSYHYENIIFIDGNHEFRISKNIESTIDYFNNNFSKLSNVVYLDGINNVNVRFGNVSVIGANSWYDWAILEPYITRDMAYQSWLNRNKDAKIDFGNFSNPCSLGYIQVRNIKKSITSESIDKAVEKIIVVTHSCPLKQFSVLRNNLAWDMNTPGYFNSQLEDTTEYDVNNKISHWIFGHSHFRKNEIVNNINYINNVVGYEYEINEKFDLVQIKV